MLLTARPEAYIYPPRTRLLLPRSDLATFAQTGWLAQYKVNDSRLLLKLLPERVEFWSRHATLMSYTPTDALLKQVRETQEVLGLDRDRYHLLDGGLLHLKHRAIKETIAVWDILVKDGEQLLGISYRDRYRPLYQAAVAESAGDYRAPGAQDSDPPIGALITPGIFVSHSYGGDKWEEMWRSIERVNRPYPQPLLEGLVLKSFDVRLQHGFRADNNGSFMIRSRVTTRRHQF